MRFGFGSGQSSFATPEFGFAFSESGFGRSQSGFRTRQSAFRTEQSPLRINNPLFSGTNRASPTFGIRTAMRRASWSDNLVLIGRHTRQSVGSPRSGERGDLSFQWCRTTHSRLKNGFIQCFRGMVEQLRFVVCSSRRDCSGTKYWFRVAAIGTDGQGPWSDPATKIAP